MNAQTTINAASNVYAKIAAVQAELAKIGISKDRKNLTPGANYNFRGIDEIYNTLAPLMASHGLCILPRMASHVLTERGKTQRGNTIWSAVVEAEFDFVSADDGTKHTVRTYGEAMDSSDKATNKAMSAAYKYAALMTFAIPTEGDNDADAVTHEVAAREKPQGDASDDAAVPGGMPDTEFAKLANLLKATGVPAARLLKEYKVDNLRLLDQDQYGDAINRLNDKLAKKAREDTNRRQAEPAHQQQPAKDKATDFNELLDDEVPF